MHYELGIRCPELRGKDHFIAPSADIIGNVILENQVSVWFNVVIRADCDLIHIGECCNIQDGAVLHTDPGIQMKLGRGVTVGHGAMLHGCEIGDHALVGINSTILNNAKIGKYTVIGANSLITEKKVIPDYSLVMGVPGQVVKSLDPEVAEKLLQKSTQAYVGHLYEYQEELKVLQQA